MSEQIAGTMSPDAVAALVVASADRWRTAQTIAAAFPDEAHWAQAVTDTTAELGAAVDWWREVTAGAA